MGTVADRIWYPIWDAGLKLGHAVRTVKEALALAADDLDTATGLLQVRHLAGDRRLTDELARKAELGWRKRSKRWLATMARRVRERHARAGEVAFLLEPDLKEGRGGLRDVHALGWAQAARSILWETDHAALGEAYGTLLDVRVELHRRTGRPGDRLLLQDQDAVADALGHADADALMRAVAHAARTIAWTSDDAWARIESSPVGPLARARRPRDLGGGGPPRGGREEGADRAAHATLPTHRACPAAEPAHGRAQRRRPLLAGEGLLAGEDLLGALERLGDVDRLVVARRTWRTTVEETGLAGVTGERERYLAARRWRAGLGLPDQVFVRISTETKPCYVDLTGPLYVQMLCTMLRTARAEAGGAAAVTVSEALPEPSQAWLPDAAGRKYSSELRFQITDPEPYVAGRP